MVKLLKPVFTLRFKKQYKKLPANIQRKFIKQLQFLLSNYRHPSLQTRKMEGIDRFEARIDIHYRFTFELDEKNIILRTIGPHDEGLGKR